MGIKDFLTESTTVCFQTLRSDFMFVRRTTDEDGRDCVTFCAHAEGHVARLLGYYYPDSEEFPIVDVALFGNLDFLNTASKMQDDVKVDVIDTVVNDPKGDERVLVTNINFKSKAMRVAYQATDPWRHKYKPIVELPTGEPRFAIDINPDTAAKFGSALGLQNKLGTQPNQCVITGGSDGVWAEFGRVEARGTRVLLSEEPIEEYRLPVRAQETASILNWAVAGSDTNESSAMLVGSDSGIVIGISKPGYLIDINCPPLILQE